MERDVRNLRHNKSERPNYSDRTPSLNDMRNGEERYTIVNGSIRLYTKHKGILGYTEFTRA